MPTPPTQPTPSSTPHGRRRPQARLGALAPKGARAQVMTAVVIAVLLAFSVLSFVLVRGHGGGGTLTAQLPPTPPSPSATPAAPSPSPSVGRSTKSPPTRKDPRPKAITCSRHAGALLGGNQPTHVCLPTIGVDTTVMELGLNSDRSVQVPPLSRVAEAGWYKYSAAPGAQGPTVILGHIDSAEYGEGVFYRLGQLHDGDHVVITRDDGEVALYRITDVAEVSKSSFPTSKVYGSTPGATIRLITCGGRFDASTGNYVDNIIAYGRLVSLKDA